MSRPAYRLGVDRDRSSSGLRLLPWWALLAGAAIACTDEPTTVDSEPTTGDWPNGPSLSTAISSTVVNPDSLTVAVGGTATATCQPLDSDGASLPRNCMWYSRDTSIATVTGSGTRTGTITGRKAGVTRIRGAAEGKGDSVWVTVGEGSPQPPPTPDPPPPPPPPPSGDVAVLLAAGDIADCSSGGDEATAKLLDGIPRATVLTLGDNVYPDGTTTQFANCYEPSWGRHKARTRPSPGNHDYHTSGASGYYGYFGASAGDPSKGYYSYNLGDWHIISLNSNISMAAGSTQETWLRADLAANPQQCTLAYWHHPRFSSSSNHGNNSLSAGAWQALYAAGAEIVLSAHDHTYERFAPQTPGAVADPARGIRQFVVGTGGRSHYGLGTRQSNSEVFNGSTYGVLKLTLGASSYAWEFLPVAGQTFTDTGTGSCDGGGEPPPPLPTGSTLSAIGVTPGAVALDIGASKQFAAVDTMSDGTTKAHAGTWSATGGAVTSGGLYQAGITPGSYRVIAAEGGTADTAAVTINPPPPDPPPPPPPVIGANCFDGGPATVTLSGVQASAYSNTGLPANSRIDARLANWTHVGNPGKIRAGGGSGICWHGGRITGTLDPETTSWSTYHDAYGWLGYGTANEVVEDLRVSNFGDGISWQGETHDNWTVRRVHLLDMHDDCVEDDWMKSGRIEDVLFEGCYVFLATRPRSSVSSSGAANTVTVDGAIAWMKPTKYTYSGAMNATGTIFKVDKASPSRSPKMRLRNLVLRVDAKPGIGDACLNPGNLVIESVHNVVVWLGSGDYPCLPLPSGWTLTRDKGVWDQAVADWKARHPGL